jgi:hypothetical protein
MTRVMDADEEFRGSALVTSIFVEEVVLGRNKKARI